MSYYTIIIIECKLYIIYITLSKMFYYTIIIVKYKPYIVYITLAYILYFAFKKKYKAIEYNIIAEYK